MRAGAVVLPLALLWLSLQPSVAQASPMDGSGRMHDHGELELEAGIDPNRGADETATDIVTSIESRGDQPRWLILPAPGATEDPTYPGGYAWCRDVEYVNADNLAPGEEETMIALFNNAFEVEFARHGEVQGWPNELMDVPCPLQDMEGLPAAVVEAAVRDVVVEQVPRPEPRIPPGYALTGMPAYLVTGHELTFGPLSETLDFGIMTAEVSLSGSATSTVDWGDGTTGAYSTPGLPYPNGEIDHTYTHKGAVTVQIIDTWTVAYDLAGGSLTGTIEATLEPVTIDGFEVREYRAVRVSPDS